MFKNKNKTAKKTDLKLNAAKKSLINNKAINIKYSYINSCTSSLKYKIYIF